MNSDPGIQGELRPGGAEFGRNSLIWQIWPKFAESVPQHCFASAPGQSTLVFSR